MDKIFCIIRDNGTWIFFRCKADLVFYLNYTIEIEDELTIVSLDTLKKKYSNNAKLLRFLKNPEFEIDYKNIGYGD